MSLTTGDESDVCNAKEDQLQRANVTLDECTVASVVVRTSVTSAIEMTSLNHRQISVFMIRL